MPGTPLEDSDCNALQVWIGPVDTGAIRKVASLTSLELRAEIYRLKAQAVWSEIVAAVLEEAAAQRGR